MRKENIAAILCSSLLIGFCLVSPMVMSELQNKNVVGKMRFDEKEKVHQKKTARTLLEKIELYRKSWQTEMKVDSESEVSVFESPEEIREEDVINVVEKEWMRLYQRGLLASPPDEEYLKNIEYYVQTYVNAQYEFVTIWDVYMSSGDESGRLEVKIEEDSGKIINLYHSQFGDYKTELYKNKYPDQSEMNEEKLVEWLAKIWGEYIDAEFVGTHMDKEKRFSYSDGVTDVEYDISVYPNELVIWVK